VRNSLVLAGVGQNSIDSEGIDLIDPGRSNQSGELNGTATVLASGGNNQWTVNGTATIDTGSGSTSIGLGAVGRLTLTGTNDWWALNSNGGTARYDTTNAGRRVSGSIEGGAVQLQTYEGRIRATTADGGTGAVMRLDHGDATIRSAGPDTIWAGDGDIIVIVSGRAQVHAGTGPLAVYGRSDMLGADVYAAGGDMLFDGDTGNITYHGGTQDSSLRLRLSNCTVLGGAGRLTATGGMHERIVGGVGGIDFNEAGGGGNDISTAAGSVNSLALSNPGHVDSHGQDTITTAGGNQWMDVYGNSRLTLGAGNSQLAFWGIDTVKIAGGSNILRVAAGADVTAEVHDLTRIHSEGTIRLNYDGATAAVRGTADVSAEPSLGAIAVWTDQSQGPVDINAGVGSVLITSTGADTIHLGAGRAALTIAGDGSEVWAGSGTLTLGGYGPTHNFTLHGAAGTIRVDTDGSAMRFIGGAGTADLTIGGGSVITLGAGHTAVHKTGGAANLFSFGAGTATIDSFRPGIDHALLAAGQSIVSQGASGGAWHATLNTGATIAFIGLTDSRGLFI